MALLDRWSSRAKYQVFAIVMLAVAIASCVFAAFWFGEYSRFVSGAQHGYSLRGTYQDLGQPREGCFNAAFMNDGIDQKEGEWQLAFRSPDGGISNVLDGVYRVTEDPNVYSLYDHDGLEVGTAHLSYSSNDGTEGSLFITYGDDVFHLPKISSLPALFEEAD